MDLKKDIYQKAYDLGASIVRCASVENWEKEPIQPQEFWPQNIWPWSKNIIVLAIPLFLPMVNSAPSMMSHELYNTSNRIMDDMAYHLAAYINSLGYRAIFFPRDCYADIASLLKKPMAAFSHVVAGYYAGVGTFGDSHNLITKQFGPRIRIVSVITDAPIEEDGKLKEQLCIHCKKCMRECPSNCFSEGNGPLFEMDKDSCTTYHLKLLEERKGFPCGKCSNVCPIGEDRVRYKNDITQVGIHHIRSFGL